MGGPGGGEGGWGGVAKQGLSFSTPNRPNEDEGLDECRRFPPRMRTVKVLQIGCPPWLRDRNLFQIAVDYDPSVARLLNLSELPNSLEVFPRQLAWAAMTSGRHLALEQDAYSERKRIFNQRRVDSALGFVGYDADGFLVKDDVLDELESTEKGHIAFAIGSLCATIASFLSFNAIALVHTETMERYHPGWIEYHDGQLRRPDYVAVTKDYSCFVVEAKGRYQRASDLRGEFLDKSGDSSTNTAQAAAVSIVHTDLGGSTNPLRIKNFTPTAFLGVATEYGGERLSIFAADPPPGMTIKVSPAEILDVYFSELDSVMHEYEVQGDSAQDSQENIAHLEIPEDLQRFWEAIRDGESEPVPFWRQLGPSWEDVSREIRSEEHDRFGMLQKFYSESIKRAEGTEQTADGVPLWAITHFEMNLGELMFDPKMRHALATAEALWGYRAVDLVQELIDGRKLDRQPDGTTIKFGR